MPSKPHFSVDENANVYWTETGKKLKPFVDKDGYRRYNRHSDGVTYHVAEHRAVAEVFVVNKNPEKYTLVNHIDGNNQNNSILNLEWTITQGIEFMLILPELIKSPTEKTTLRLY